VHDEWCAAWHIGGAFASQAGSPGVLGAVLEDDGFNLDVGFGTLWLTSLFEGWVSCFALYRAVSSSCSRISPEGYLASSAY